MPYKVKGKCVYKKDTNEKVGCTKGSVKKYLSALHTNINESEFDWVESVPTDDLLVGKTYEITEKNFRDGGFYTDLKVYCGRDTDYDYITKKYTGGHRWRDVDSKNCDYWWSVGYLTSMINSGNVVPYNEPINESEFDWANDIPNPIEWIEPQITLDTVEKDEEGWPIHNGDGEGEVWVDFKGYTNREKLEIIEGIEDYLGEELTIYEEGGRESCSSTKMRGLLIHCGHEGNHFFSQKNHVCCMSMTYDSFMADERDVNPQTVDRPIIDGGVFLPKKNIKESEFDWINDSDSMRLLRVDELEEGKFYMFNTNSEKLERVFHKPKWAYDYQGQVFKVVDNNVADETIVIRPYGMLSKISWEKDTNNTFLPYGAQMFEYGLFSVVEPPNESKKENITEDFFYKGVNPTVDLIVIRDNKVLLIQRGDDAEVEPGKWGLPGGFHDSNAKKGGEWKEDKESSLGAAKREVKEETGLDIDEIDGLNFVLVGVYEGGGRDERDNDTSWSRSTVYMVHIPKHEGKDVEGSNEVQRVEWVPIKKVLQHKLAFDHHKIIEKALTMNESDAFNDLTLLTESSDFDWIDDVSYFSESSLKELLSDCGDHPFLNYNLRTKQPYRFRGGPVIYYISTCDYWWDTLRPIPNDEHGRGAGEWFKRSKDDSIALLMPETEVTSSTNIRNLNIGTFRSENDISAITTDPRSLVRSFNGEGGELHILLDKDFNPRYDLLPDSIVKQVKPQVDEILAKGGSMNESEFDWVGDVNVDDLIRHGQKLCSGNLTYTIQYINESQTFLHNGETIYSQKMIVMRVLNVVTQVVREVRKPYDLIIRQINDGTLKVCDGINESDFEWTDEITSDDAEFDQELWERIAEAIDNEVSGPMWYDYIQTESYRKMKKVLTKNNLDIEDMGEFFMFPPDGPRDRNHNFMYNRQLRELKNDLISINVMLSDEEESRLLGESDFD